MREHTCRQGKCFPVWTNFIIVKHNNHNIITNKSLSGYLKIDQIYLCVIVFVAVCVPLSKNSSDIFVCDCFCGSVCAACAACVCACTYVLCVLAMCCAFDAFVVPSLVSYTHKNMYHRAHTCRQLARARMCACGHDCACVCVCVCVCACVRVYVGVCLFTYVFLCGRIRQKSRNVVHHVEVVPSVCRHTHTHSARSHTHTHTHTHKGRTHKHTHKHTKDAHTSTHTHTYKRTTHM